MTKILNLHQINRQVVGAYHEHLSLKEYRQHARNGEISRIIVKKYDRFSRNMREYLNITDTLDKLGVSVISLSEPFNTETKEGRMMRNNLLNFAEFERETIAARVADAYDTKARETGFYQGGKVYFGYVSERRTINGKTGSVLVPGDKAEIIKTAYEVYKEPSNSLKNVIEKLREIIVDKGNFNIDATQISRLLESPLYVRADAEIYRYYAAQGVEMLDDISAYDGVHGLFLHGYRNNKKGTKPFIKVGYHEGLIDSEAWLAVQDKKSHNHKIPSNGTSVNSWLTGLIKCAHCGYSPFIVSSWNKAHTRQYRYYHDCGFRRFKGCFAETWKTRPDDVEQAVFEAMNEPPIHGIHSFRHFADSALISAGLDVTTVSGALGRLNSAATVNISTLRKAAIIRQCKSYKPIPIGVWNFWL